MAGEAGGERRNHQCMTRRLSLIGPPLWHFQAVAEEEGGGGGGRGEEGGGLDVIENSEILADWNDWRSCLFYCCGRLKGGGGGRGGGMCAAYNKYGRRCSDWQQQDKSNLGCKQQVGGKRSSRKHCSPDS